MYEVRLLHDENLARVPLVGSLIKGHLTARCLEVVEDTLGVEDPGVSILIRTRNNVGQLRDLADDLHAQRFKGEKEIIVVDTESTDGTRRVAGRLGMTVLSMSQAEFSYPRSLNRGFEAASHPYVLTLVGHSALSSNQVLRAATRHYRTPNFGGAYGVSLPNANASRSERVGSLVLGIANFLGHSARSATTKTMKMGMLASNCSIVSREAWKELGGYDESYESGGEGTALARSMMKSGMTIMREPVISPYHTHELGPIQSFDQLLDWFQRSRPRPFNQERLWRYRPDLRDPAS